ncbi:MAG: VTT domain-containing protein [Magnetococcales bacterium]|nr:VTT domain-containing protein [Magnetococcales bacterium]
MWPRLVFGIMLLTGIGFSLVYRDALDLASLETWLRASKTYGKPIYVILYALATVLFLPGSLLTLAGGALFGPWIGGLLSLTGATLGAGIAFLISRHLAGAWVARRAHGMLERLLRGVEAEGWRFVALTRLVPLFPFNLLNYALGLTRIRFSHYLITSFVCMAPGGLAYAWLGHAGREAASGSAEAIRAGIWALALLALVWMIPRWVRRWRGEQPARDRTGLGVALLLLLPGLLHAEDDACLPCHLERDAILVSDWQISAHAGAGLACAICHGAAHDGHMTERARGNEACLACHEKAGSSYQLSKHGVLVTLEGEKLDRSQPLRDANQRAPTCGYCHMHASAHAGVGGDALQAPCQECHAPRFVESWFLSNAEMIAIAGMKEREFAEALRDLGDKRPEKLDEARELQKKLQNHLQNVRLGVGHQSPDDLWWHGQAALDGDLARLKSLMSAP